MLDQDLGPVVGPGRHGDPHAGRRQRLALLDGQGRRHGADHALADGPGGLLALDVLAEHDELVTGEACDGVLGTGDAEEPAGDGDEELVANVVAELVVDELEVVEVDEQDRHRRLAPSRAGQGLREPVHQQAPVGKVGQGIVERPVHEVLLGALPARQVLHLPQQEVGLGLVADRRRGQRDPDVPAVGRSEALLYPVAADASGEELLDIAELDAEVGGVGEGLEGAGEQLGGGVAEQHRERPVHLEEATLPGDEGHADGSAVEGGLQPGRPEGAGWREGSGRGTWHCDHAGSRRLAPGVGDRRHGEIDIKGFSALADELEGTSLGVLACERGTDDRLELCDELGGHHERQRTADHLASGVAEQARCARVPARDDPVAVDRQYGELGGITTGSTHVISHSSARGARPGRVLRFGKCALFAQMER